MSSRRPNSLSKIIPDQEGLSGFLTRYLRDYLYAHSESLPQGLYQNLLREVEDVLIKETLHFTEGNKNKAADILGIHRNTLRQKLNRSHSL
jgi:DNA-binding protein Fis